MRKLFAIALCMLSLAACDNSNKNASTAENERTDSLNRVIAQKDNEINDMLSTLNEIQEGFNIANNNISSITMPSELSLRRFHCENNSLSFANLPLLQDLT